RRSDVKVFPDPEQPNRPIKSGTFVRLAGEATNVRGARPLLLLCMEVSAMTELLVAGPRPGWRRDAALFSRSKLVAVVSTTIGARAGPRLLPRLRRGIGVRPCPLGASAGSSRASLFFVGITLGRFATLQDPQWFAIIALLRRLE